MLPPLKPHASHQMRQSSFGDPYVRKCAACDLTSLQDEIEFQCGGSEIDWKKLLLAYATSVMEAESVAYQGRIDELSDAENEALDALLQGIVSAYWSKRLPKST